MKTYKNHGFPVFPPGSTDILLVRHGESDAYVEGEPFPDLEGWGNPTLSPNGKQQAESLAERLLHARIDAIYTSDLDRTRQTAAPLAGKLGYTPSLVRELREVFLGDWEGGLYRKMAHEGHPAFIEHVLKGTWDAIPGAETDQTIRKRTMDTLREIAQKHANQRVMVVTHAGIIAAVLTSLHDSARTFVSTVDQTSITHLVFVGDRPILRSVNDTSHLGDPLLRPSIGENEGNLAGNESDA